jgi:hypothetical protein
MRSIASEYALTPDQVRGRAHRPVGALNVSPGFWSAMDALGSGSFYEEISLPGIVAPNR